MVSTNRIVQIVLVLLLATLCKKHFQLQEMYDKLRDTCEIICLRNIKYSTNQRHDKSEQLRPKNTVSVFMHSSTLENAETSDDNQDKKRFTDVNEPTFYDNDFEQDVTFTSLGNVDTVAGIVHQTSNVLEVKQEVKTNIAQNVVTLMDSTNDEVINPSENLFENEMTSGRQFTGQDSLSENQKQSLSQPQSLHVINPSETTNSYKYLVNPSETVSHVDVLSEDINVKENDDQTYDFGLVTNNDQNSDRIVGKIEHGSSDSTKESNVFVLQTSLTATVKEEANNYNYFDTEESTRAIDTGFHRDFLHLMTDSTGYEQVDDDMEEEIYDDDGEDDFELNIFYTDNKKGKDAIVREATPDYIIIPNEHERQHFIRHGTSASCHQKTHNHNICQFQNICYNTREKDFVFFKGENSVLETGSSNGEGGDNVFDINLSTIDGHNTGMLSIVTLHASVLNKFSVGFVTKKSIALHRFKPDNIMHVLHDDVFPLFHTLNDLKYPLFGNKFDVAIIFTDKYDKGNYFDLYSSLSTVVPISPWQYNKTYDLLCFPSLHVGLEMSTIWYQYGFFQPQGPSSFLKSDILENVRKATDSLSLHFKSECFLCSQGKHLVLLSRKDNRLILNEGELIMSIAKVTRLKIMSVSLETHSLSDIISTIRLSKGVIAMHGSLLSLIVFLPPGSIVIELFPFAVNPSHYTPFKTFCNLPGSTLIYKSWANPSLTNSVPHPDRPANEGGIRHLPKQLQSKIISQTEVPKHLCCDNPSWLYHIYQDTIVDINAVIEIILSAIQEMENVQILDGYKSSNTFSKNIPGPVRNLLCERNDTNMNIVSPDSFVVSWDVPWVFDYDASAMKDYKYEIVIQMDGDKDNVRRLKLPAHDVSYHFESKDMGSGVDYNVWLQVVSIKGDKGQSRFIKCS